MGIRYVGRRHSQVEFNTIMEFLFTSHHLPAVINRSNILKYNSKCSSHSGYNSIKPFGEPVPLLSDLQFDNRLRGCSVLAAELLVLDGTDTALQHG